MFDFDIYNNPEPLGIYLFRPDKKIVCNLNGIDEESCSIKEGLNNQYILSFTYNRYINDEYGNLVESNGYMQLDVGMYIFVEKIGFFRMQYPPYKFDGEIETKEITSYSCDCELEDKDLCNFKINTGEEDSLEYLVTYDDDETESLVNAYTNLPYDYILFYDTRAEQLKKILNKYSDGTISDDDMVSDIVNICTIIPRLKSKVIENSDGTYKLVEYVSYNYNSDNTNIVSVKLIDFNSRVLSLIDFYTKYHSQLSLVDLAIEKCNCDWSVGEIDKTLSNKKFQFSIDNQNIYSFFTQDIATTSECMVSFDILRRKINITSINNIGEYTGIQIDKETLLNTIEVTCDEKSLSTRFNVSGGENLNIDYVNFGSNRIDDISYFIHAQDLDGNNIYIDKKLSSKYHQYTLDREIARVKYIELTKSYNQYSIDISELKYKVPNDYLSTDYSQFTLDELNGLYQTYDKMLTTLISLYKTDYGNNGVNSDGSIKESFLKTTEYWYDYYAYKNIMVQIQEAINAYNNGSNYGKIDSKEILAKINAWKTEWSLYGIIELENKISTYNNSMKVLVESNAIIIKDSNTDSIKTWSELTSDEKKEYALEENYKYEEYNNLLSYRNSAQSYLDTLNSELNTIQSKLDECQSERKNIIKLVSIKNYDRNKLNEIVPLDMSYMGENSFTENEISTINILYIDNSYSNENILKTSLDNIVTEIDLQKELFDDAKEQLSIYSQPQINFKTTIENLLSINKFEFMSKQFLLGNYIIVQYFDDYYVKLRITSIKFNPLSPSDDLIVEFSNYVKSNVKIDDVASLLGNSSSNKSSSVSSGGSSSSNGNLGDDLDITLSNTMLSKLVNSEMFGTAVTNVILDTIDVNSITTRNATFASLVNGTTVINGKCIKTGYITDEKYNGSNGSINNTEGTIINLENGLFNFIGGALKWDGNVFSINGDGTDLDLTSNEYIGEINETLISWQSSYDKTYIDGGKIYSNSITANQLSSNSITSEKIKSNAITTDKLATNVLTIGNIDGLSDVVDTVDGWSSTKNSTYIDGGKIYSNSITANQLNIDDIFAKDIDVSGNFNINHTETLSTGKDGNWSLSFSNGTLKMYTSDDISSQTASESYIEFGSGQSYMYSSNDTLITAGNSIELRTNGNIVLTTDKLGSATFDKDVIINGDNTVYGNLYVNKNLYLSEYTYGSTSASLTKTIIGGSTKSDFIYFGSDSSLTGQTTAIRGNDVRLYSCGGGGVYLGLSGTTAVTSDENLKHMYDIDKEYESFFMNLEPKAYVYKDTEKNKFHRKHLGFGARQVEKSLIDANLTTEDFAGVVINKDITLCSDEMGTSDDVHFDELYSLRYEEFISLNTMMIQKLYKRVDELETIIKESNIKMN